LEIHLSELYSSPEDHDKEFSVLLERSLLANWKVALVVPIVMIALAVGRRETTFRVTNGLHRT